MSDNSKLPPAGLPPYEVASMPEFKKKRSLNSSMITIIVGIQGMHAAVCCLKLRTFFLQVDDTHFRLGSHFLSESETLKAIIANSETDSIRLQNVTAAKVRALWRFFNEGMYDDYKPSNAEWMDLLSIANTYGLKRVHRRAVAEIEDIDVNIDPVIRVLLAKQLNNKQWLAPAYVALCIRTDPINESEAEKLGMSTYVKLVRARESIYRDCVPKTTIEDCALSVTSNLRCCGHSPSQLHDGANGTKICPGCQQIVIPGPGIQPVFTNNNRRCCSYQPYQWIVGTDGTRSCPGCRGIVVPAVVTFNLYCCRSYKYYQLIDSNGAKICPHCQQIVIPGPGGADFTNNNRQCCNNQPSSWISQPDGSQICPKCKGITLPCRPPMSLQERALDHVKRVFDLED